MEPLEVRIAKHNIKFYKERVAEYTSKSEKDPYFEGWNKGFIAGLEQAISSTERLLQLIQGDENVG